MSLFGDRLLDLGAGTGQFVQPLAQWCDARVIALEPSSAMRAQSRPVPSPRRCAWMAGVGEALPLCDACIDVAWLSTVFHQVRNRSALAAELARVVRPGGRVLIRGLFRGLPISELFSLFPGIDRSVAEFPSMVETTEAFEGRNFALDTVRTVDEPWSVDLRRWIRGVQAMRFGDSMLRRLDDEEFAAGLAGARALLDEGGGRVTNVVPMGLVVVARR